VNQVAAKTFQEMLEATIREYHERRKHLTAEEAGATQEQASENIIKNATEAGRVSAKFALHLRKKRFMIFCSHYEMNTILNTEQIRQKTASLSTKSTRLWLRRSKKSLIRSHLLRIGLTAKMCGIS